MNHNQPPQQDLQDIQRTYYAQLLGKEGIQPYELDDGQEAHLSGPISEAGGIEQWAIIRVPASEGADGRDIDAYLGLGRDEQGFFLTSDATDVGQLDFDEEWTRSLEEAPLAFGKTVGTELVVGRSGFVLKLPGYDDMPVSKYGANIVKLFGPHTSRQHFRLRIDSDGGLTIISTSPNKTGVLAKGTVAA
ncbi:MAG: hypothetical protein ACYCPS_02155 [Candidatus Saccharimonadales bacterium]